jgi:hypothetical protein
MPIGPVSREAIFKGLEAFDADLRATAEWSDWESNGNYKWAVVYGGRKYPVKKIIELVTRTPRNDFSGGTEANSYLQRLGFDVQPVREEQLTTNRRNPPWSYEEVLLAMDLYVQRGLPSPSDPAVLELSRLLNRFRGGDPVADPNRYRNPNGVHLKLANFRARERPGHGMSHGNRLETLVWDRFADRHDLLAAEAAAIRAQVAEGGVIGVGESGRAKIGFLKPFAPKADLSYQVEVEGGVRAHDRQHETLVNAFADWLIQHGLTPLRNRAIDLGLENPPVVIEAKQVQDWPSAIRQAVGQLYEYRFFNVVQPDARLVFLASKAVPHKWINYLEFDRGIVVAWHDGKGFQLSERAITAFGLRGLV